MLINISSHKKELPIVGVAAPFSGPRSTYGNLLVKSIEKMKPLSFDCIYGDDQAIPDKALDIAKIFIDSGVKAVIGHFNSECARSAGLLYAQNGIPFLMPASTAVGLCEETGAFRLCATDERQILSMKNWIQKAGYENVLLWSDNSIYGNNLLSMAIKIFKGKGKQLFSDNQLNKFSSIIFFGSHFQVNKKIIELRREGLVNCFLACDDCGIQEFYDMSKGYHENLFSIVPDPDYGKLIQLSIKMLEECDLKNSHQEIKKSLDSLRLFHNNNFKYSSFKIIKVSNYINI